MRAAFGYGLIAFAVAAGCRPVPPPATLSGRPLVLPLAGRALPPVDASAAPAAPPLGSPPPPPANYYHLTAEDCRRQACANSSLANLLAASAAPQRGVCADNGTRAMTDMIRATTAGYLAEEIRNRTAGGALTAYYKLLELELTSDVLAATLVELDDLLIVNEKLADNGFKPADDAHELKKQRLELLSTQAKLRSGIQQLNGELKAVLAIDPGTAGLLLPADQVRVVPDPLDVELAVQLGLTLRPELNLLRTLANVADPRAVNAIRKALVGLAPPLAAVLSATAETLPLLTPWVRGAAKADAVALRQQVLSLLADRERVAVKEIRAAADDWTTARQLAGLARSRFEMAQGRVDEYEKRARAGQSVESERRRARLDALQAEGELVSEIAKWKAADVTARQAIGLLGRD